MYKENLCGSLGNFVVKSWGEFTEKSQSHHEEAKAAKNY